MRGKRNQYKQQIQYVPKQSQTVYEQKQNNQYNYQDDYQKYQDDEQQYENQNYRKKADNYGNKRQEIQYVPKQQQQSKQEEIFQNDNNHYQQSHKIIQKNFQKFKGQKPQDQQYTKNQQSYSPEQLTKKYSSNSNSDIVRQIDPENQTENTITSRLIMKFLNRQIDCPICSNNIDDHAKIWNCVQCSQTFHLSCTKKWINKKQNQLQEQNIIQHWDCPICKFEYKEEMPEYYCFCGKIKNVISENYLLPHSCGEMCGKKRGTNCMHGCELLCHPGVCPPCKLQGPQISCYCGKQKQNVMCSSNITQFDCNNKCSKILNCNKHLCDQKCHPGKCSDCVEKVEVYCFCKKFIKEVLCGNENFSCQSICGQQLDCGNHFCDRICHDGPCNNCKLKPELVKKCPCGQYNLSTLSSVERITCLDPIPCCGLPCRKPLKCDEHYCKKSCHSGPCDKCKVEQPIVCRCGSTKSMVECWTLFSDDPQIFICDKVCKKKLRCKVHNCGTLCCNKKKEEHLCLKVCGKQLSCGQHLCSDFCHIGSCEKCRIVLTQPKTCTCGKTQLRPPISCGTAPPECNHPCSRQKECNHPCDLNCHVDSCPPCNYPVQKICRCGLNIIDNVPCSKEALCLTLCPKIMSCKHVCKEVCHVGKCPKDSEQGCGKKCGNQRMSCKHQCLSICHPGQDCPQEECKVEVKVRCSCGNRETFVQCGSTENEFERILPCNNVCQNLKRFGTFYDSNKKKQPYFPASLIRFAKNHFQYLQKLENSIEQMIKSNKDSIEMPLVNDQKRKLAIQILLERHYHLQTQYYVNFKNPFFVIQTTEQMIIPKPLLSEYYKKVEKGLIQPEVLPFQVSLKFNQLGVGDSSQMLEMILKDFKGQYYLEKADKQLTVHFWEQEHSEQAVKKLKKSQSSFNSFSVEVNQKLQIEEEKEQTAQDDVIRRHVQKKISTQSHYKSSEMWSNELLDAVFKEFFIEDTQEILDQRQIYYDKAQCTQMCPQEEIDERNTKMEINIFEQDPRTNQLQMYNNWAVKCYRRIDQQSQNQPKLVRTIDTLSKTLNYLINKIVDVDVELNTYFKLPCDKQNKKRILNFDDVYEFLYDRLKAIRQDITIINCFDLKEVQKMLEMMIRFYIICIPESVKSECIALNLNILELQTCLSMLIKCYGSIQDVKIEDRAEFMSYLLLVQLHNKLELEQTIQTLHNDLIESEKIQNILCIINLIKSNDYIRFFQILQKSDFVLASLLNLYVNEMRIKATINLMKSKYQTSITEYTQDLQFDDQQQALDYLKSFNIDTQNLEEQQENQQEQDNNPEINAQNEQEGELIEGEQQKEQDTQEDNQEQQQQVQIQYIQWETGKPKNDIDNSLISNLLYNTRKKELYNNYIEKEKLVLDIVPRQFFIKGEFNQK